MFKLAIATVFVLASIFAAPATSSVQATPTLITSVAGAGGALA